MSGLRVMAAFAAGASIAAMVVGVARVTDVVEPSTAVADSPLPAAPPPAGQRPVPAAGPAAEPRPEVAEDARPASWRAPQGGPEEVTAGVLAKVASRRAQAERCEPPPAPAAAKRRGREATRQEPKAERCPPEEGIESVEIDWNASPATN